jgi:MoxR-like ATPase
VSKNSIAQLIGRQKEMQQILACLEAKRNVLLEGPVGVGKTYLALSAIATKKAIFYRVDGDGRYSEQKLSGWFDPPSAMKNGFNAQTFMAGPLVEAMQRGAILFINELNRMPEGVQNILLPAIDERVILIPRLGEIRAAEGFQVIATQNPKEFVATSHLSEAILDRFELVVLDYQDEHQEQQIVRERLQGLSVVEGVSAQDLAFLSMVSVKLVRITRGHPRVRRGASVRAALSVAEITLSLLRQGQAFPEKFPEPMKEAFKTAALLALPTRIELERNAEGDKGYRADLEALILEWAHFVWNELEGLEVKKKT